VTLDAAMAVFSNQMPGGERKHHPMDETDKIDAKHVVQAAVSGLPEGDSKPFIEALADDVTWIIKGETEWSKAYHGKKVVLDKLLEPLARRIDGRYRMVPHRFISEGDVCVVEGQGHNLLRDGRRYDNNYCWVCRVENGKIRELIEYLDTDLVRRLFVRPSGVVTPAP
jgi:ketosteroid isomerase-like protein